MFDQPKWIFNLYTVEILDYFSALQNSASRGFLLSSATIQPLVFRFYPPLAKFLIFFEPWVQYIPPLVYFCQPLATLPPCYLAGKSTFP